MSLELLKTIVDEIKKMPGHPLKGNADFVIWKRKTSQSFSTTPFGKSFMKYIRKNLWHRVRGTKIVEYIKIGLQAEKHKEYSIDDINKLMRPFTNTIQFSYMSASMRENIFHLNKKSELYIKLNTVIAIMYSVAYGNIHTYNGLEFEWQMHISHIADLDLKDCKNLKKSVGKSYDSIKYAVIADFPVETRTIKPFEEYGNAKSDLSLKNLVTMQVLMSILNSVCNPLFFSKNKRYADIDYQTDDEWKCIDNKACIDKFNKFYNANSGKEIENKNKDSNFYRNESDRHKRITHKMSSYVRFAPRLFKITYINADFYCCLYDHYKSLISPTSSNFGKNAGDFFENIAENDSALNMYSIDQYISLFSLSCLANDKHAVDLWCDNCIDTLPLIKLYMALLVKDMIDSKTEKLLIDEEEYIHMMCKIIYRLYYDLLYSTAASLFYECENDAIQSIFLKILDDGTVDNEYGINEDLRDIYKSIEISGDQTGLIYGLKRLGRYANEKKDIDMDNILKSFEHKIPLLGVNSVQIIWIDFYNPLIFENNRIKCEKIYSILATDKEENIQLIDFRKYNYYSEIFESLEAMDIDTISYIIADGDDEFYDTAKQKYEKSVILPMILGAYDGIYNATSTFVKTQFSKKFYAEDSPQDLTNIYISNVKFAPKIDKASYLEKLKKIYDLDLKQRMNLYPFELLHSMHKKNIEILLTTNSKGDINDAIIKCRKETKKIIKNFRK